MWMVGIWIDYVKQTVALRTDFDSWNVIEIPFHKLESVQILEDGYTIDKITPGIFNYHLNSTGYSTGLSVRIVASDINTGTNAYFVKLYNPIPDPSNRIWVTRIAVSDSRYKAMQECAQRIVDELKYVGGLPILNSSSTSIQLVNPPHWYSRILIAKKRKVLSVSSVSGAEKELTKHEVRALMNKTNALRIYNKSMSMNQIGNICLGTGAIILICSPLAFIQKTEGSGIIQTSEPVFDKELQGKIVLGALGSGCALVLVGCIFNSSSKSLVKKSVNTHNYGIKSTSMELKFGITGNGVGLALYF